MSVTATEKTFLDTNVLVYQFDHSAPVKQKRAIELVEHFIAEGQAVISSQVVQEFMNVALRKFDTRLSVAELALVLSELLAPLCAHTVTLDFYERALKLYSTASVSFYDSLIIQAALDLNCRVLLSEDLQDGRQFGLLTIKNPFV